MTNLTNQLLLKVLLDSVADRAREALHTRPNFGRTTAVVNIGGQAVAATAMLNFRTNAIRIKWTLNRHPTTLAKLKKLFS